MLFEKILISYGCSMHQLLQRNSTSIVLNFKLYNMIIDFIEGVIQSTVVVGRGEGRLDISKFIVVGFSG